MPCRNGHTGYRPGNSRYIPQRSIPSRGRIARYEDEDESARIDLSLAVGAPHGMGRRSRTVCRANRGRGVAQWGVAVGSRAMSPLPGPPPPGLDDRVFSRPARSIRWRSSIKPWTARCYLAPGCRQAILTMMPWGARSSTCMPPTPPKCLPI